MEANHCCFACRYSPAQAFSCSCYALSWGATAQHFLSVSVCLPQFLLCCPPPPQTQTLSWATNWKRCEYYIPRRGIITASTSRSCVPFSFHPIIMRPVLLQKPTFLCFLSFVCQIYCQQIILHWSRTNPVLIVQVLYQNSEAALILLFMLFLWKGLFRSSSGPCLQSF